MKDCLNYFLNRRVGSTEGPDHFCEKFDILLGFMPMILIFTLGICCSYKLYQNYQENKEYKSIISEYQESLKNDGIITLDITRVTHEYGNNELIKNLKACKDGTLYLVDNNDGNLTDSGKSCSVKEENEKYNEFVKKRLGKGRECKICIDTTGD